MEELKELIRVYDLRNRCYQVILMLLMIALLSVLNCVSLIFKYDVNFFAGLGCLTVLQIIIFEVVEDKQLAMAAAGVLLTAIACAAFIGYLCYRIYLGKRSAFIITAVIYGIDSLILLYLSQFMSFIIHLNILWLLYEGYKAMKGLENMESCMERLDELLYGEEQQMEVR